MTFRTANERNGRVAALAIALCKLSSDFTSVVILTLFSSSWGNAWRSSIIRSNLQTHHYIYRALCREDIFLEDHWIFRLGSVSCLQRCTLWHWKCDYYTSTEVKARHPLRASKRCQIQGNCCMRFQQRIFAFLTKGRDLTLWVLAH